jgi:hypothetical protein
MRRLDFRGMNEPIGMLCKLAQTYDSGAVRLSADRQQCAKLNQHGETEGTVPRGETC